MNEWESTSGEHWATNADRYTRMLARFGDLLIAGAHLAEAERVLDVGCGCGDIAIASARRVGSAGHVIGIDLSTAMLAVASGRAAEAGLPNIELRRADAVTYRPPEPVDVVVSRFGVMFFDDPVAAFMNIRAAIAPGGRLAFVCWQAAMANDWTVVPGAAMAEVAGAPPPDDPLAPGPFAFADPDRVTQILTEAGFGQVNAVPATAKVWMGADAADAAAFVRTTRRGVALLDGVDAATAKRAVDRVRSVLEPYESASGVELAGAVWLVTGST